MGTETTDDLVFFVNGKKIVEQNPEPEASLLQYLRRTRILLQEITWLHYPVNACLFPLCAAHGLAITTVEGVGNPTTGLHDVQKRLVESHGLQCGFCTPGFVMSVFTLLRNNPTPTRDELEKAIEGNLCRCTGYRPIVQAFNSLCKDACPLGELCCKNQDTTSQEQGSPGQPQSQSVTSTEQVAIFPSELQLSDKYSSSLVKFKGRYWTWMRPTTFDELLALKKEFPDAPVIMGNTTAALQLKLGQFSGSNLIYGGGISSLKAVELSDYGIELGAALTMNELETKLKDISGRLNEDQRRHFPAFLRMIDRYGADQIRNTATLSGSILSGRSNSDIITILAGCGASVVLETQSSRRKEAIDGLTLNKGETIKSVILPFTKKNDYTVFFKHADRQTFSLALVNSCISVLLSDSGTVEQFNMAFGGISAKTTVRQKALSKYTGRPWDQTLLQDVLASLPDLLKRNDGIPDDKYKLSVAAGFFFKFFNHVYSAMTTSSEPLGRNATSDDLGMKPSSGIQVYEPFTDPDQSVDDALHRPVPNVSSEAIVAGEAVYVDDMPSTSGELFLSLVTSKRAHAMITKVDPTAALNVPGVHGFIGHTDVTGLNRWGTLFPDEELFASKEVHFYGQPIGAVIAETREIARHASWLVKVEYQDKKCIFTAEEAIKENAFYDSTNNISDGNIETGFAASDTLIEGEYSTGHQEHFYLEPFTCLVMPRQEFDEMDVCVTTQGRGNIQTNLSRVLGIPLNKITVTVRRIGGGFGGKECRLMMLVGPAAIAARKYKRPVRGVLTREMDMEISGKRHPYLAKYKVGVLNSGKIKSLDLKVYINGGSSLDLSAMVREINMFKTGDLTKFGLPLVNYSLRELWDRCRQESDFCERLKAVNEFNRSSRWRKRGIVMTAERFTIGFMIKELYQGAAIVNIYSDGTVLLSHGGVEMGQGINTKMIQIASRVLGIPADLIYTSDSSTRSTPNCALTAGSMGTDVYGPAVMDACQILIERLEPLRTDNPNISWKELITRAVGNRVKLTATGFSRYDKKVYDPSTKTGSPADYYTYGVICTEVDIDVLTGENQVLQCDIVMDVGKSLNPAIDIGQIEGGFVQGLGMVTSEFIDVDENGKMLNCSPLSYKIPNVRSIPRKFNITLVREDNLVTPVYSAKAIGEPPLLLSVSVIMAIKEAIKAAREEIGLHGYFRLDSPATVERIRIACGDQLSKGL